MNESPLCLTVKLLIRAGEEERAERCLAALAPASRTEPGCLAYNVHHSTENPRQIFIYELYRDRAALAAHQQSAHFARYAAGELYGLVEERAAEFYAPVAVAPSE
ncbi:MAG TPA: putative quinol monooxygenase [Terriglobales bacterium]|nr:putative quinol monooxygenase [Terriglobales bacterium]